MPKVSICVPAYGNPGGIARLLASVAEQTYTDYEVILTDDSPDNSVQAAAERSAVNNLHYHKNETRLGATGNWNESVRRASGAYIKMMHHDDWFSAPDSLANFVALLDENPKAILGFSGTWQVTLEGSGSCGDCTGGAARFARSISVEQEALIREDWRNLYFGNYIGAPSATIYRANDQIFEAKLTWVMDVEYYMRLLQKQPYFACSHAPLVCIGVSDTQLTEQCRADGALNVYEYGFLMEEFDLAPEKKYRDKLTEVALKFRQPYGAVEKYGIVKEEFQKALQQKKKDDFIFLLGVAKRKIFRK